MFGAIVDSTCLFKKHTCEGEDACLLYDNKQFRLRLHGVNSLNIFLDELALIYAAICVYRKTATHNINGIDSEADDKKDEPRISETLLDPSIKT